MADEVGTVRPFGEGVDVLSSFSWGDSVLGAFKEQFKLADRYVQDTEAARVIRYVTGDFADIVPLQDELAIVEQDYYDDSHLVVLEPVPGTRRHCAIHFTVDREVTCHGAELQFTSRPFATIGENSVWLAIYSADNADFTPAGSRTLLGVIGPRHGHQISYLYWTLSYVVAEDEVALTPGVHYFLVLCAADPWVAPAADEWDGVSELRTRQIVQAGENLLLNNNSEAFPSATSTYTLVTDQQVWYRLYTRRFTLEDVPIAQGVSVASVGEVAVLRRTATEHQVR